MLKEGSGLINEYYYYGTTGENDLKSTLAQVEHTPTTWENCVMASEHKNMGLTRGSSHVLLPRRPALRLFHVTYLQIVALSCIDPPC